MSKLTKQVNFWLPEQMLKDLDEVATIELIDRSAVLRKAIDLYVRRHRNPIYKIDLPVNIIREVDDGQS